MTTDVLYITALIALVVYDVAGIVFLIWSIRQCWKLWRDQDKGRR